MYFLIRHLFLVRFPPRNTDRRSQYPCVSPRFGKPRPASRNNIGKSRNSPLRYERAGVYVYTRTSDQRTITPRRIFTSGRIPPRLRLNLHFRWLRIESCISFFFAAFANNTRSRDLVVLKRKNQRPYVCITTRVRARALPSMKFQINLAARIPIKYIREKQRHSLQL